MKHAIPPTQFITDNKGNKVAVVISTIDYNGIMEDMHDLSVIAKRKEEATVPFHIMKNKFKK